MKILFVSTSIPPYPDMQSIRNYYLIDGLIKANNKVTVVSASYPWNNDDLYDDLNKHVNIFLTKPTFFVKLSKFLAKHRSLTLINKVFNVAINHLAFPDIHMFFNMQVKRLLKKDFRFHQYDVIITSSGSFTSHIYGHYVKKKFGTLWIAEYGDPWGLNIYGRPKKLISLYENAILRLADGIILTTNETMDAYKQKYRFVEKFIVLPCGYEYLINDNSEINYNNEISFGYIGVAYKSSRNLSILINVIKNNPQYKLEIVGSYSKNYLKDLEINSKLNNITFHGRVSYDISLKYISNFDVLVIVGNYGSLQIPGKTYIYLSSKKPILYIRQEEKRDPTYNFLKTMKGIVFCENSPESIKEAVHIININYAQLKKESLQRVQDGSIANYQWSKISSDFSTFVDKTYKSHNGV